MTFEAQTVVGIGVVCARILAPFIYLFLRFAWRGLP